ncbi:hypothetical protein V8E36_007381 [Tilletia maclaganii]
MPATNAAANAMAAASAATIREETANGPSSKLLWIAFLQEFSLEAAAKGSKAEHAYKKASHAIKTSAQDFTHPAELTVLRGIGPGTVGKLVTRLKQWCLLHNQEMPPGPASAAAAKASSSSKSTSTGSKSSAPARKRQRADDFDDGMHDDRRGSDDDLLGFAPGDNDSSDDEDMRAAMAACLEDMPPAGPSKPKAKKRKAPTAPKAYVPHLRSGAYGILLALLSQTPTIDNEIYLTKGEIIRLAQPWCDSDYVVSSKGPGSRGGAAASRVPASMTGSAAAAVVTTDPSRLGVPQTIAYTAWSSMKTLITKGLVCQKGNPPKFCLSEDGWELAAEMKRVSEGRAASQSGSSVSPERPQQRAPAALPIAGPSRIPAVNGAETPTPPDPKPLPALNAASSLRIPVITPGLFSSSDPPSSSPHYALDNGKGKGRQLQSSREDSEIVLLSDTSTPEPEEDPLDIYNVALGGSHKAQAPSRPQQTTGRTAPSAAIRRRANPIGHQPGLEAPQRSISASRPPSVPPHPSSDHDYRLDFIPGSQQSCAIAISDSDDDIVPVPRRAMPHKPRSAAEALQRANSGDSDGDVTLRADISDLPIIRADGAVGSSRRVRSGPVAAGSSSSAPLAPPAPTLGRSHSDSMAAGAAALSRPGESMQSTLRREVTTGLALSPRSATRMRQGQEGDQPAVSTRPRHARLSQALPRREIGATGMGWQAQMSAETGASQSQDMDMDDDDDLDLPMLMPRAIAAKPPAQEQSGKAAQKKRAYDSGSDIDIDDIMRGVESGIAARLGHAPRPDARKAKIDGGSVILPGSTKATARDESDQSDFEVLEPEKEPLDRAASRSRAKPRDSLPAVPQPLLPGMAAVSVAADSSFDMFDDSMQGSSTGNTRLLPPRAPIAEPIRPVGARATAASTSSKSARAPRKSTEWVAPAIKPIVWPAGSYDIVLLLDTRELKHGGSAPSVSRAASSSLTVRETVRGGRCHLSDPLVEKGVPVEVRALELGDVVWIARKKGSAGTEMDEVVLDYIVERKRLDDLVQSIPDGRWNEQKFRLSLSGLSKVFYLIEDYNVDEQMRRWGPQIATAISSTQVIDGFFVQRTAGVEASLDWLRKMHLVICQMHKDKPLHVLPDTILSRPTYLQLQTHLRRTQPSTPHHITFESYRALNAKNGSMTVGEVWARMMLCVRGMSEEKVGEVIRVWRTGRDWWETCRAVLDGEPDGAEGTSSSRTNGKAKAGNVGSVAKRGQMLMADRVGGMIMNAMQAGANADATAAAASLAQFDSRKKIGTALSAKVWEIWSKEQYS